jgi:hypothetical protein
MSQQKSFEFKDLEHRQAENFQLVYCNNASLSASFFDASITFSEVVGGLNKPPIVEDRVTMTMSWEHLKALGAAIQTAVNEYETGGAGGKIRERPKKSPAAVSTLNVQKQETT